MCSRNATPRIVALSSVTALLGLSGAAVAQDIEEITVTATKREATIQDVPFSINAQTAEDIQRTGATDLEDLSRNVAGLSVQNLLTPETIVRLLEHARGQPWGEAFREALPAAGMAGSTLEGRLPELGDRLRAKTGTVTHVNSLSGYLVGNDGQEMTFSIMTNASGRSAAAVRRGMDRIIRALANGGDPR